MLGCSWSTTNTLVFLECVACSSSSVVLVRMGGSVALALALHPDDVWICSDLLRFCHGEFTALEIVVVMWLEYQHIETSPELGVASAWLATCLRQKHIRSLGKTGLRACTHKP